MFIEYPAIEGRLLMGAMTARQRPDGFLYYQISIWNSRRPITSGPFTDWDPRSWTTYHGDGSWTCVGPDGAPVPTIRLENFRDGLEDFAAVRALEDLVRDFDVERLSPSPSIFDPDKLRWMNGRFIRQMDDDELGEERPQRVVVEGRHLQLGHRPAEEGGAGAKAFHRPVDREGGRRIGARRLEEESSRLFVDRRGDLVLVQDEAVEDDSLHRDDAAGGGVPGADRLGEDARARERVEPRALHGARDPDPVGAVRSRDGLDDGDEVGLPDGAALVEDERRPAGENGLGRTAAPPPSDPVGPTVEDEAEEVLLGGVGRPRSGGEATEERVPQAQDGVGGARIEAERLEPRAGEARPLGLLEELEAEEEVGLVLRRLESTAEGAAPREDVALLDERRERRRLAREAGRVAREKEGAEARVKREARHPAAERGRLERSLLDGSQPAEEAERPLDGGGGRRLEPVEERGVSGRPEEDVEKRRGEVGPEELRLLERTQAALLVLGEEPEREAGAEAPGASGPLVGARARDSTEEKPVEARTRVEPERSREAGVDDGADPVDRQRGLGDVRREDDAPAPLGRGRERRILRGEGEVAVKDPEVEARVERRDRLASPADLGRSGEEGEDVPRRRFGEGRRDGRSDPDLEGTGIGTGRVPHLDRERTARHGKDRGRALPVGEEPRDGLRVERCGGDEEEEVLAQSRPDLAEHREAEVGVAAPLVELVEHHAGDPGERGVVEEAPREDPLGDDEDAGPLRMRPFVADLVADPPPDLFAQLGGEAPRGGPCRDPAGLEDPEDARIEEARVEKRSRHAGRLAGAGRGEADERATPSKRRGDLGKKRIDRKRRLHQGPRGYGASAAAASETDFVRLGRASAVIEFPVDGPPVRGSVLPDPRLGAEAYSGSAREQRRPGPPEIAHHPREEIRRSMKTPFNPF